MMKEELGLIYDKREPKDTAITTFIAFNLLGLIPLSPFVGINIIGITDISSNYAFIISSVFTAISFFVIGIVKGKIVKILVEDASPVEYDQPLFLVEPK